MTPFRKLSGTPRDGLPEAQGSIKRDVDVFLHTYTSKKDRLTVEEYIDCPFRNLKMMRHNSNSLRFTFGPKSGLSPQIVAFACADFAVRTEAKNGMPVARLAVEPGSAGSIFKMNENDIAMYLEDACRGTETLSISNVNGEPHIVFPEGAKTARQDMLEALYDSAKSVPRRVQVGAAP